VWSADGLDGSSKIKDLAGPKDPRVARQDMLDQCRSDRGIPKTNTGTVDGAPRPCFTCINFRRETSSDAVEQLQRFRSS